jgi:hypothetical protein
MLKSACFNATGGEKRGKSVMLKIVAVFLGKSLAAKGISAPAILPSRSDSSSNASRSPYLNGTDNQHAGTWETAQH